MELRSLHQGHSIELRHPLAGPQALDLTALFRSIRPTKQEAITIAEARQRLAELRESADQFSEQRLAERLEAAKRAIAEDISEEGLANVAQAAAMAQDPEVRRRVASEVADSIVPQVEIEERRMVPIAERILREARSKFTQTVASIDVVDQQLAAIIGVNELSMVLSFAADRIAATFRHLDELDQQVGQGAADALLRDRVGA